MRTVVRRPALEQRVQLVVAQRLELAQEACPPRALVRQVLARQPDPQRQPRAPVLLPEAPGPLPNGADVDGAPT